MGKRLLKYKQITYLLEHGARVSRRQALVMLRLLHEVQTVNFQAERVDSLWRAKGKLTMKRETSSPHMLYLWLLFIGTLLNWMLHDEKFISRVTVLIPVSPKQAYDKKRRILKSII